MDDAPTTENLSQSAQSVNFDEFAGMTPDMLIGFYVALRDRIAKEKEAFSKRMAPATEKLERLNGVLLAVLQANGADSLKSPNGTVYQTTKKSATVSDMGEFRDYVMNTGEFDLVDMRANSKAVEEYVAEHHGNLPPGINFSQFTTIGVRRGTAKPE